MSLFLLDDQEFLSKAYKVTAEGDTNLRAKKSRVRDQKRKDLAKTKKLQCELLHNLPQISLEV